MLAILQLDAASTTLLDRLVSEGRMPTVAELRKRALRVSLGTASTGRLSPAAHYWTLYTGVPAREHGLTFPFLWSPGAQRIRPAGAFPQPQPIWERALGSGGRCLVVDAYELEEPVAVDGVYLGGWQYRNRVTSRPASLPAGLRDRLVARIGAPALAEEVFGAPSPKRLALLARRLEAAPRRAAAAVKALLARDEFDVVWVTFSALHLGGHQLWNPSAVVPASRLQPFWLELNGALERVYEAVDGALGELLALLPAGADVIVPTPLGMEDETTRADLLPGMLAGVLDGPARARLRPGIWRLRAAVPVGARAAIAGALPDRFALELTGRLEGRRDWSSTRAFALPSDHDGFVRLNLRGREREGVVDPADADELTEQIVAGLPTYCDPDGASCVERVERCDDAGSPPAAMPDVIVHWRQTPSARIRRLVSPRFGAVDRIGAGIGRSGGHELDASALVLPGRSHLRDGAADLTDIAATAYAALGGSPGELAGRSLLAPP